MSVTVKVQKQGTISLPASLRRRYAITEGNRYTVIDLGDGALLLVPETSKVAQLGDQVQQILAEQGVSTEEMLQAINEERERYHAEHYAQD